MIKFRNLDTSAPYKRFKYFYDAALLEDQKNIEAISISSFNSTKNEVESRYVNLKYIDKNEWIFFSNYESLKAKNFEQNNQISALFFWNKINVQIRMKAFIKKASRNISDKHFLIRSDEKNALSISSDQSKKIKSYDEVVKRYQATFAKKSILNKRPESWGGFSFTPYYFEFWEGEKFRLNKRNIYEKKRDNWQHFLLQP